MESQPVCPFCEIECVRDQGQPSPEKAENEMESQPVCPFCEIEVCA
jgi:ribosomal protein L37AE/L43A